VKQYRELNQDRLAFALMISSILQSPSKTGFAKLLGVTGGAKFQALSEFFDWAMRE
jgi:hypothetical protein